MFLRSSAALAVFITVDSSLDCLYFVRIACVDLLSFLDALGV